MPNEYHKETDQYTNKGIVRTDVLCTECKKVFIALINFDIEGNHKIYCHYCKHIHWRKIEKGKVTEDRWGSGGTADYEVMTRPVHGKEVSSVSAFIRDSWMNRSDNY